MKRTLSFLLTLLLFSFTVHAQRGGLESLREIACQKYAKFGWFGLEYGCTTPEHNFFTFTAPRDSVSAEDIYTLRSVFNAAMATADEANLYESHRSNCDTISYSVVFGGNLLLDATSNKGNFEMSGHYFTLDNSCSGILDITCNMVKVSVAYATPCVNRQEIMPTDNTPIEEYLSELIKEKSVKVHKVSYQKRRGGTAIICYNMGDDNSVTYGRRIDVTENVDRIYAELSKIMHDYAFSGQRVSMISRRGDLGVILNEDQYVYMISTSKDGILQILALEHTGKGLFLPAGWQNFVEYNEGKTK